MTINQNAVMLLTQFYLIKEHKNLMIKRKEKTATQKQISFTFFSINNKLTSLI